MQGAAALVQCALTCSLLVAPPVVVTQALSHPSKGLVLTGELDENTKVALMYIFAFRCGGRFANERRLRPRSPRAALTWA